MGYEPEGLSQSAKDITRLLVARTYKMPTSDLATRASIYTVSVAGRSRLAGFYE